MNYRYIYHKSISPIKSDKIRNQLTIWLFNIAMEKSTIINR